MKAISAILLLSVGFLCAMESDLDHEFEKAISACDAQKIESALRKGAPVNDSWAMRAMRACLQQPDADQAGAVVRLLHQHGVNFNQEEEKAICYGKDTIKHVTNPVLAATSEALKLGGGPSLEIIKAFRSCGVPFTIGGVNSLDILAAHRLGGNPHAVKIEKIVSDQ